MIIKLNGKTKEIKENSTILDLFYLEDIVEPVCVEVYVNKKKIDFEHYEKYKLKDGDELEYIYLFASG